MPAWSGCAPTSSRATAGCWTSPSASGRPTTACTAAVGWSRSSSTSARWGRRPRRPPERRGAGAPPSRVNTLLAAEAAAHVGVLAPRGGEVGVDVESLGGVEGAPGGRGEVAVLLGVEPDRAVRLDVEVALVAGAGTLDVDDHLGGPAGGLAGLTGLGPVPAHVAGEAHRSPAAGRLGGRRGRRGARAAARRAASGGEQTGDQRRGGSDTVTTGHADHPPACGGREPPVQRPGRVRPVTRVTHHDAGPGGNLAPAAVTSAADWRGRPE